MLSSIFWAQEIQASLIKAHHEKLAREAGAQIQSQTSAAPPCPCSKCFSSTHNRSISGPIEPRSLYAAPFKPIDIRSRRSAATRDVSPKRKHRRPSLLMLIKGKTLRTSGAKRSAGLLASWPHGRRSLESIASDMQPLTAPTRPTSKENLSDDTSVKDGF